RRHDDPQRRLLHRSARHHHDADRAERRRQVDPVQDHLRRAAGEERLRAVRRRRYHQPAAAGPHRPGYLLRAPRPQHFSRALPPRQNRERGGVAAEKGVEVARRLAAAIDRFPVLRAKADRQSSTLSGGEQKMLEIARGLMLEPKLMLIDEPSIGLSPIMVVELFAILRRLREGGMTVLMIEQNAKRALELSDDGIVLELGRTRLAARAADILADPRIGHLFLGGGLESYER